MNVSISRSELTEKQAKSKIKKRYRLKVLFALMAAESEGIDSAFVNGGFYENDNGNR